MKLFDTFSDQIKIAQKKGVQVSNDTESVIDTDTAGQGIAGIDYRVLGIAHHYQLSTLTNKQQDACSGVHSACREETRRLLRRSLRLPRRNMGVRA